MPDRRRLQEEIELGRRLMSLVGSSADRARLSAYIAELEAKLPHAEDDKEEDR
jgi:hypothetical protein